MNPVKIIIYIYKHNNIVIFIRLRNTMDTSLCILAVIIIIILLLICWCGQSKGCRLKECYFGNCEWGLVINNTKNCALKEFKVYKKVGKFPWSWQEIASSVSIPSSIYVGVVGPGIYKSKCKCVGDYTWRRSNSVTLICYPRCNMGNNNAGPQNAIASPNDIVEILETT